MSKLKSFVVKTKRIKTGKNKDGSRNYVNYLMNNDEQSHIGTNIVNLSPFPKNQFLANVEKLIEEKNKGCKTKIGSDLQSFTFNLPNVVDCNLEQWNELKNQVVDYFKKEFDIDEDKIFVVLHDEKTKNSHLNVCVCRVNKDSDNKLYSVRELDQHSVRLATQKLFNNFVANNLNYDKNNYYVVNKYKEKNISLIEARKREIEGTAKIIESQEQAILDYDRIIREKELKIEKVEEFYSKVKLSTENALKSLKDTEKVIEEKKSIKEKLDQSIKNNTLLRIIKKSILAITGKSDKETELEKQIYLLERKEQELELKIMSEKTNGKELDKKHKDELERIKTKYEEKLEQQQQIIDQQKQQLNKSQSPGGKNTNKLK